jgi:hypothetical protein
MSLYGFIIFWLIVLTSPFIFALIYGFRIKRKGLRKYFYFFLYYSIISVISLLIFHQFFSFLTARADGIILSAFIFNFFIYLLIGYIFFLIGQALHFLKEKLVGRSKDNTNVDSKDESKPEVARMY